MMLSRWMVLVVLLALTSCVQPVPPSQKCDPCPTCDCDHEPVVVDNDQEQAPVDTAEQATASVHLPLEQFAAIWKKNSICFPVHVSDSNADDGDVASVMGFASSAAALDPGSCSDILSASRSYLAYDAQSSMQSSLYTWLMHVTHDEMYEITKVKGSAALPIDGVPVEFGLSDFEQKWRRFESQRSSGHLETYKQDTSLHVIQKGIVSADAANKWLACVQGAQKQPGLHIVDEWRASPLLNMELSYVPAPSAHPKSHTKVSWMVVSDDGTQTSSSSSLVLNYSQNQTLHVPVPKEQTFAVILTSDESNPVVRRYVYHAPTKDPGTDWQIGFTRFNARWNTPNLLPLVFALEVDGKSQEIASADINGNVASNINLITSNLLHVDPGHMFTVRVILRNKQKSDFCDNAPLTFYSKTFTLSEYELRDEGGLVDGGGVIDRGFQKSDEAHLCDMDDRYHFGFNVFFRRIR